MSHADEQFKAYEQLCTSYRAIDDFRAKMLGYLPLATFIGIFFQLDKFKDIPSLAPATKSFLAAIGAFGFLVTLGLFAYEIYGIKKCAALIKAGQQIECQLRLDGQFKKRPQNVLHIINEPFAAGVIYPTVLAAYTFFAVFFKWPQYAPWIAIVVLICGLAGTLFYDRQLRKGQAEPAGGSRAMTEQDQRMIQSARLIYSGEEAGPVTIAPNIAWHVPGHNPVSGTYHGLREYTKLLTRKASLARWDFALGEIMVNGNYVMTTYCLQGERKGKTVDLRGGHLMRLTDEGQVIEGWDFTNSQDVLDEFLSAKA